MPNHYSCNNNKKQAHCNKQFNISSPCCNNNKDKFCFQNKKENTIGSLYEVEHFLCNFRKIIKGIKLYNIFRF